jgi:uncharacterized membrane protein
MKKESSKLLVIVALVFGLLALLQNKSGVFSDLLGFWNHFSNGENKWPYTEKKVVTSSGEVRTITPLEYPALTGLVMWLLSFLVSPSLIDPYADAREYFRLSASIQVVIFALCTYLVFKITKKEYAYYFLLAPAVLYSLHRNWDIWAVAAMLSAILFFEKKKYTLSAILLSTSIATKFFPIVLLLPIVVIFLRKKEPAKFIKFGFVTLVTWVLLNLPFALINFEGWAYFYKFSAKRGLGSASIYELLNILMPEIKFSTIHFYFFNIFVFLLVTLYLIKLKTVPTLAESSFFVMFAFIYFNKQYSMQYVIWLTSLAVLTLFYVYERNKKPLIYFFVIWQVSEIAFQYAFFQNRLTLLFENTDSPMTITVTTNTYALIGLTRYLLAVIFTFSLARYLYKSHSTQAN